jgi:hypothetical protein
MSWRLPSVNFWVVRPEWDGFGRAHILRFWSSQFCADHARRQRRVGGGLNSASPRAHLSCAGAQISPPVRCGGA